MDHDQATATMAAERYLLGDMGGGEQAEFEEHFFDCGDCAADVRDEAMITGAIRAERRAPRANVVPMRRPSRAPWLAAAAAAGGMAILGYQNVLLTQAARAISIPHTHELALEQMRSANDVVEAEPLKAAEANELVFNVGSGYHHYRIEIRDAAGKAQWSRTIETPAAAVPLILPPHTLKAGKYTLVADGIGDDGKASNIGAKLIVVQD